MQWPDDDIAAFLETLGQTATLDDGTLSGAEITAIYTLPFSAVDMFDAAVESATPYIDCATADVTAVVHGTALRVADKDYVVTGIENENIGFTRLILRERFD